jgi:hypothetical protein
VLQTQRAIANCNTGSSQKVNAVHTFVARRAGVAFQMI